MTFIDVSYHQGYIDWGLVRAQQGIEGAFIKATGEETAGPVPFKDSRFIGNWNAARATGLPCGAYHFMDGSRDSASGKAEAEFFMKTIDNVGGFKPGDLRPAIDVEWPPKSGKEFQIEQLGEMVEYMRRWLGKYPIIYTARWYWPDITDAADFEELVQDDDGNFNRCLLWMAQYTSRPPIPVEPWKHVALWQYTDKGHVDGIKANTVDMNLLMFPFKLSDLQL